MPLRESNNNFCKKLPIVKNRRSQFCGLRSVQENYFEALIADHAFAGLWLSKTLIAAVGKCFRYSKFLGNICSVKQLFYRNKLIGSPLLSQTIMLSLVHIVHWPKTSLHTNHFETFLFTLLPKCPEAPGAICSKGGWSYP